MPTIYETLNYGHMFFIMLGLIPLVFTIPCWVVAKFVYEPMKRDALLQAAAEETAPVPYEKQYPISKAENGRQKGQTFKGAIVLSHTPKGLVYMRYCEKDEGFEYWSDKVIDYKYLETVARKYVTTFSCKDLYIDRFELLKVKLANLNEKIRKNNGTKGDTNANGETEAGDNAVSENVTGTETETETETETDADAKQIEEEAKMEKEDADVFASFKSYNKKGSDVKNQTKILRKDVVCDKANKYLNRGIISDAMFGEKKKASDDTKSAISFSQWKNLWYRYNFKQD